jgi:putative transposase
MVEPGHPKLSIVKQCDLVKISRSSYYYEGKGESGFNLDLMRLIDEQFLETPYLWLPPDGEAPSATGLQRGSEANTASDAKDGAAGGFPTSQDLNAASGASCVPVLAPRTDDRSSKPGVVL